MGEGKNFFFVETFIYFSLSHKLVFSITQFPPIV